jgi:hypothetical protein
MILFRLNRNLHSSHRSWSRTSADDFKTYLGFRTEVLTVTIALFTFFEGLDLVIGCFQNLASLRLGYGSFYPGGSCEGYDFKVRLRSPAQVRNRNRRPSYPRTHAIRLKS